MKKRLLIFVLLSGLLLLAVRLFPVWNRLPGAWMSLVVSPLVLLLVLSLIFFVTKELLHLLRGKRLFVGKELLPLAIFGAVLLDLKYNPFDIDLKRRYGSPWLIACHKTASEKVELRLTSKKEFVIRWKKNRFYQENFLGSYQKKDDLILLDYRGETFPKIGNAIRLSNDEVKVVAVSPEGNKGFELHYGFCYKVPEQ